MKKGTYIPNFVVLVLNLAGGFRLMCYVVKSLSKIRVAGSTCTRGLYMAPTTPTRVRVIAFGPTVATMPHKPISEV